MANVSEKAPLDRVRELCLSLPETSERLSHGQPSFFIRGKKTFVMYLDDHHGDGRLALWLAAPEGMQQALVEAAPEHYFRPPYVGHRGWLGVRLDRDLAWDEIAGAIEDAYLTVAPRSLIEAAGRARDVDAGEPSSSGGSPAMTPKVAPCGSATTAKRPTPSSWCGAPNARPPSSWTLATDSSQSATVKYASQKDGVPSGAWDGIGIAPAIPVAPTLKTV